MRFYPYLLMFDLLYENRRLSCYFRWYFPYSLMFDPVRDLGETIFAVDLENGWVPDLSLSKEREKIMFSHLHLGLMILNLW